MNDNVNEAVEEAGLQANQYEVTAMALAPMAQYMTTLFEAFTEKYPLKTTAPQIIDAVTVPVNLKLFITMTTASALLLRDYGPQQPDDIATGEEVGGSDDSGD